jgi:predicted ester cyclase
MSAEENKEINRRIVEEIINQGNLDLIDELYDENYIGHMPPDEIRGTEGQKQLFSGFRNGFPDLKATIEDQIAEGDILASRQTITGTHKGEFQGIAPTGKKVEITVTVMGRIANGKMVESWVNMDALGMMVQLGVVPPPQK